MLKGVGNERLGEWRERGPSSVKDRRLNIVHIRRRLSNEEQIPVGAVEDRRGTPYHRSRAQIASNNTGIPVETLLKMG